VFEPTHPHQGRHGFAQRHDGSIPGVRQKFTVAPHGGRAVYQRFLVDGTLDGIQIVTYEQRVAIPGKPLQGVVRIVFPGDAAFQVGDQGVGDGGQGSLLEETVKGGLRAGAARSKGARSTSPHGAESPSPAPRNRSRRGIRAPRWWREIPLAPRAPSIFSTSATDSVVFNRFTIGDVLPALQ